MSLSIKEYLPEYFNETAEDVTNRAIKNAPANINTIEGDLFWDAIKPFSEEIAKFRKVLLLQTLKMGITQTATGKFLDLKGEADGIPRKEGSPSIQRIQIIAAEGTKINAGRIVSTESDEYNDAIQFLILETITIDSTEIGITTAECLISGKIGNVAPGSITMLTKSINGVKQITNTEIIKEGIDDESDQDYLERILENASNPPNSANDAHYEKWARECIGVADCKVIPQWDGNGTVKVIIVADGHKAANETLLQEVHDYIDPYPKMGKGQAPIGAKLTVASCKEKAINIKVNLALADGYILNTCKDVFSESLDEYLKQLSFKKTKYISFARIGNLILNVPGVIDYSDLYLNNMTSNCSLLEDEIAIRGSIEPGVI